jgi:pantoate--beta-alanine ligase
VASSQEGFSLDYAEIIDERDFSKAVDATKNKRAIIAGWLNGVRLIDNMEMKLGAVR